MSGGLKEQWGVDAPAKVGPDAQSQDLKAAFEKPMDTICASLQYTAANGERSRHEPLAARRGELIPRYQSTLDEVDPANAAKAKDDIDKLLADAQVLCNEASAFRDETEKAIAEWHSREPSYDTGVSQVEELQAWQHPKEGALRGLADGIRAQVNERAYPKAVDGLGQFLPGLQPIYEDYQRQKVAQGQYEPAVAALQPRLQAAPSPSPFAKLAPMQSGLASAQSEMAASAQSRDFVSALEKVSGLGTQLDAYSAEVAKLQQLKQQYEQALAQVQPKLQAAPSPSPFKKLEPVQSELSSGQKQMESSAQAEEFEQALTSANDLGTKADAYTAEVAKLQQLKQQYEQALAQVQPKLQAAPSPSPFKKLEPMRSELSSGQQQMESSAQAEEFEQALTSANDLGAKADAYSAEVAKLQQLKQQYEQALAQVQPKLQAAPSPSPFKKLEPMQAELSSGQQQMESSAQAEEFEQALAAANDLGTKADAYTAEVAKLQQLKQQYEQALAQVQPKLQAAPSPSPFKKLEPMQAELASGQQQMESAAQAEEFEQALAKANDLGTKADAYTAEVAKLQQLKQQYEQALAQVQPKLQAAPSPSPFKKLEPMQAELTSGQQQMESSAQAEEFEQALAAANDLGTKADAYTAEVAKLQQLKQQYEQALAQVQPKLQAAPSPSPFKKLEPMQAELTSGQQQMESAAQAEEFEQALSSANDLGAKADAYTAEVAKLQQLKQQYEQALAQVQPKLQAAPSPSPFKKLEPMQAELTSGQQQMESSAQAEEFEQALTSANDVGAKADAYTAEVAKLQQLKQQYEQALAQVQPKLQAAPSPSPFKKLEPMQAELTSGQQQMESSAQAEEFEQALAAANDLGTKADAYSAEVAKLQQLKQQYEQALAQVQPKLQAAPSPSPFKKLEPMQAELASGQQQMESAAQAEEFEQALTAANDLGTKADAYSAGVTKLQQLKQQYEQALAQVQPKLQAAPSPSPFKKLEPMQAELASGQQQMESAAQAEEFEQALTAANDLGTKADAYSAEVTKLQQLKQQYEQALAQVQPKLQAAPSPSPFKKLEPIQAELSSGQQQMESAAQAEEFEQALPAANDLGTKADAYTAEVTKLQQLKQQYEQALAQVQPKLQAAPSPAPFKKLEPMQAELASGKQQMESSAQAEEFEQALSSANDLGTEADAYTAEVAKLQQLKQQYEQALAQVQPKLEEAGQKTIYNKLSQQKKEYESLKGEMETVAQGEDYEQALAKVNDLTAKVDAYLAAVKNLEEKKKQYEQALEAVKPKLSSLSQSLLAKPTPMQEEIVALQKQMEAAAQGEDYEQALKLANDLSAKLDANATDDRKLETLDRGDGKPSAGPAQGSDPNLLGSPNPQSPAPVDLKADGKNTLVGQNPLELTAVQVEIDKLAIDAMRGLTFAAVGGAFTSYLFAVGEVRDGIKVKEEAEKKAAQLKFEIAVALAVVVATPLTAGAAAALAGSVLAAPLALGLERELPGILKKAGVGLETNIKVTSAATESITRLAGKFSASDSQRILGEATKSLSKVINAFGAADKFAMGKAYLRSLATAADSSKKSLDPLIAAAKTFGALMGMYNACVTNTPEAYVKSITKQVDDFMEMVAPVLIADFERTNRPKNAPPEHGRLMFVKMNVFGRIRYARVTEVHNAVLGRTRPPIEYQFVGYVPKELEGVADSTHPIEIDPKLIIGPLPTPPPDPPTSVPSVDVKDLPDAPTTVKDLPNAPPVNVKDLPDAPTNVHDLPDVPPVNVHDLPDAPKK